MTFIFISIFSSVAFLIGLVRGHAVADKVGRLRERNSLNLVFEMLGYTDPQDPELIKKINDFEKKMQSDGRLPKKGAVS